MKQLRKLMAVFSVLLMSSLGLSSCGNDVNFPDNTMGAVAVHSCTPTSTTCTVYWTIVPNDNCGGYKITLYKGTRESIGSVVEEKTFDNRTANYTFENLTPSTNYVIETQAIPGKGFSAAEKYYKAFTTLAQ